MESVNGSKNRKGDEAKERRRKQEGILGKGAPGKNFLEKILWIENYPYVCSA